MVDFRKQTAVFSDSAFLSLEGPEERFGFFAVK
jgi:hypothetical protein